MTALPEPSWRFLLARGLPTFVLEGFVPVAVFYSVWRTVGLVPAIAASSATTGLIVLWQQRRGHDVALAAVTGVFIAIQSLAAWCTDRRQIRCGDANQTQFHQC